MIFLFFVALAMAFVVAVAAENKGYNAGAWFLYALFLWPVALVHIAIKPPAQKVADKQALAAGEMKPCPDCAELVRAQARKCRYCGLVFPEQRIVPGSKAPRMRSLDRFK